jgi:hypothetical protein
MSDRHVGGLITHTAIKFLYLKDLAFCIIAQHGHARKTFSFNRLQSVAG